MMNSRPHSFNTATLILLITLSALTCAARAADPPAAPDVMEIWPGQVPGEQGDFGPETDKTIAPGQVRRTNIARPTIQFFRPPADKDTGLAMVVCPGGAYKHLAVDQEGLPACKWLNSIGVTAVMLKYRVPRRPNLEKHVAPLQDVQRAMGLIRHRAKEWHIDPARLGVIGFSAGGHLSASLSTNFDERTYPAVDDADRESCRPDFTILIYPFYLTLDDDPTKLAPELRVSEKTPSTFIIMAQDDRVEYAYAYALALKKAKVPAELHVYALGGHGFGLGADRGPVSAWPKRAEEWLNAGGWLKKR